MKHLLWLIVLGAGLALLGTTSSASAEQGAKKVGEHVYELRIYHILPGRAKALHARFRDHTVKLLEKHGMKLIGFWSPIDAKEAEAKLIYVVEHKSKAAADKSWQAFRDDPAWKSAKEASEKDGKIVQKVDSVYMSPTDYSALK